MVSARVAAVRASWSSWPCSCWVARPRAVSSVVRVVMAVSLSCSPPLCFFGPVAGGLEVALQGGDLALAVAAEVADQPQPPRATVRGQQQPGEGGA